MIAKIRRGSDFRGLQLYLLSELKGVPPEDIEVRNLVSADTAAVEMRLVADRSQRVERAVYHIILAWAETEGPTRDEQFAIGHELLHRVGLGAHQSLLARHMEPKGGLTPGAGRHFELHLMVNRVGPDGRALAMRQDYAVVERAVAAIAAERSMRVVPGRFNGQEGFVQGSSEKARRVAMATGRTSVAMDLRAMPDVMSDLLEARANGWPRLIEAFSRHGIMLRESNRTRKKGQSGGLVMTMINDPDRSEKLSALDSPSLKWGRPTLELELGAFPVMAAETVQAAMQVPTATQLTNKPEIRPTFEETRAAALLEHKRLGGLHKQAKKQLAQIYAQKKDLIIASKRKRQKSIIDFFGRDSKVGASLNEIADQSYEQRLAATIAEQRQEIQNLMDCHTQSLARVLIPTWTDWQRANSENAPRLTAQEVKSEKRAERQDDKPNRNPQPSALAADNLAASMMMALDDHEQRRERLERNRERKATLRRGDLDARIAAIADDLAVEAAARIIRHLRSRHGLRTVVLVIAALAAGSSIAPVVLAAGAVALARRGEIREERASLRADVDEARAARTGWRFAEITPVDRARYAILTRSNLVDPSGPDAGPIIAAIGRENTARFVAWWAYASPRQRAIVARWGKSRGSRQLARGPSPKPRDSRGRG